MIAEGQKRLEILEEMGLWDEVTKAWKNKSVACVSEARMILELCGVNFTFFVLHYPMDGSVKVGGKNF